VIPAIYYKLSTLRTCWRSERRKDSFNILLVVLPLEFHEDVASKGNLLSLPSSTEGRNPECGDARKSATAEARTVEGRGAVQGGVVTNLRPEGYPFHKRAFGNGRRDVEARRQAEVGGWCLDERGVHKTPFGIDEVEIARESAYEEARVGYAIVGADAIVTPNLGASDNFQPVENGPDSVLGNAITGCLEAVVADVVEIGDEGQRVIDLPCRRYVVQVAKRGVWIAVAEQNLINPVIKAGEPENIESIGKLGPDVSGRENCQISVKEVQPDTAFERWCAVVVTPTKANRRVHARCNTSINVKKRTDMRNREYSGVRERDAEAENIAKI
jgi:hypothetical protein